MKASTISVRKTQVDLPLMDSFHDMSSMRDPVYYEKDGSAATIAEIKSEILSFQDRFKISHFDFQLGRLTSICSTHDQKYLIIGGQEDIAFYHINDKQIVYLFQNAHSSAITSLMCTSDDGFLISASCDKSIKVWNLKTRALVYSINQAHSSEITSIALTSDEKYIVSSAGRNITIWDFSNQQAVHTIQEAHENTVLMVKYILKKGQIISVSADKSFKIWRMGTWELIHCVEHAHTCGIKGIIFTQDERYAVTTGQDGSISLWDMERNGHMHTFPSAHKKCIESSTLSIDDKFLICVSRDGSLSVWDLETKTHLHTFKNLTKNELIGLTVTRKYLFATSDDGKLYSIILAGHGKSHSFPSTHLANMADLKISPDDGYVISASLDGFIQVWDFHTKEQYHIFEKPNKKGFRAIGISPDSCYIASGCVDGTVDIWSLLDKKNVYSFEKFHRGEILCIVFTSDGKQLVSSCTAETICVWEIMTKNLAYRIEDAHKGSISSVIVTKDLKYLISGSLDKSIKIWDFEQRNCIHTLAGAHPDAIRCLKLTRDDKILVSGGEGTIKLWDMLTRRQIQTFSDHHKGNVHSLTISQDDQFLLVGDHQSFTIYNLATKQYMYSFAKESNLLKHVTISSDNKWLIFSGSKSIKATENPFLGLSISISKTFSPFSPFRFMPLITFLCCDDKETRKKLINNYNDLQLFPYSWNWLHLSTIFAPTKDIILKCFQAGVPFELDIFGRTPLHYLLNNETRDLNAINYIIGKLPSIISSHPRPADLLDSMGDILHQIIQVHSPQVVRFLKMCVREPEVANPCELELFGEIPRSTSYYPSKSRVFSKKVKEGLGIEEGPNKLIIKILPFCWDYSKISDDMHDLVKSLLQVDNKAIFETKAISLIISYLWRQHKNYFWLLGILFSVNSILITIYALVEGTPLALEIAIILFALFFLLYEIFEFCSSGWRRYFSSGWNYLDMCGNILLPTLLIGDRFRMNSEVRMYMFSFVIAYYYCRWLSYFRVFKQTRRLLQIIFEICKDIRSFMVLLLLITVGFALIFQQFDKRKSFEYHLLEAYDILYSDFDATGYSIGQIIYFLIVTIAGPIVLLNMLIAIMAETYDRAQEESNLTDNLELLQMIDESTTIKKTIESFACGWKKSERLRKSTGSEEQELKRSRAEKKYLFFVEEEDLEEASENCEHDDEDEKTVGESSHQSKDQGQVEERLEAIEKILSSLQSNESFKNASNEEKNEPGSAGFNERLGIVETKLNGLDKLEQNINRKFEVLFSMMKKEN